MTLNYINVLFTNSETRVKKHTHKTNKTGREILLSGGLGGQC